MFKIDLDVPDFDNITPRMSRYHSLDIWRGLACLFVVILHSLGCARGHLDGIHVVWDVIVAHSSWFYVGVPCFFVISGYSIASSVDRIRRKPDCSAVTFVARRFRRIYPTFWGSLLFAGIVYTVADYIQPGFFSFKTNGYAVPRELSAWQWLGNITLTEEWRHHLVGDGKRQILGLVWVLCYNIQFYVIMGMILAVARDRFFRGCLVATGVILVLKHGFPLMGVCTNGFIFDGIWFAFGAGLLVYVALNYLSMRALYLTYPVYILGIAYASRGLFGLGNTIESDVIIALVFAIVIQSLARLDVVVSQSRWLKPLMQCGGMSYSIYLIHLPITTIVSRVLYLCCGLTASWFALLVTLPLCILLSLLVGRGFFCLLERRFLNKRLV